MLEYHHDVTGPANLIGCLSYKSNAASSVTDEELDRLVTQARQRNNRHGVTGMLLYEDGRFLQTLEGPPDGLDAIWSSIQRDERHSEIEILTQHLVSARLFSDWDLLLYSKADQAPKSLLQKLRRKHPLSQHVPKLVSLALDANEKELNELFARLNEKGWDGSEVAQALLEPAARALGDAWLADQVSEFDMTLALGMLQIVGHAVRYSADAERLRENKYSILLAAGPGETHMLSLGMLADQFTDAGWSVELAFPNSDEALAYQVGVQKPDALDIGLSDALPRHSKVSQLRETVKQSRWSMPGEPLVISVGGRLFAEAAATAEHVGADHARKTVAGTRVSIAALVENARASRAAED